MWAYRPPDSAMDKIGNIFLEHKKGVGSVRCAYLYKTKAFAMPYTHKDKQPEHPTPNGIIYPLQAHTTPLSGVVWPVGQIYIILPRRMLSLHGLCVYLKLRSSSFVKDQRVENAQFMSSVIPVTCPQTEGSYDAAKLMKKRFYSKVNQFFLNEYLKIFHRYIFK